MLLIIAVAFLLTGTISFYHFKKENELYHEERLKRKEIVVQQGIQFFLGNENLSSHTDSIVKLFDTKVCELARINDVDINIYSLQGGLLISSTPALHEQRIVPRSLPVSLLEALDSRSDQLVVRTRGDTLDYLSTYDYIRNFEGEAVAIINLPYFLGEELQRNQDLENFLWRLAEIYFLLFAVGAFIAFLLSNYITGSLKAIGEMIKNTKISGSTKGLRWRFKDEIGTLVEEYNRMVEALEQSAVKLAQTERESAWKEMARQVAHEIKNPLTPMRLSVQHLKQSLATQQPEKLADFSESMIAQIDSLSQIAEAFSRFASLPEMQIEPFALQALLPRLQTLYPQLELDLAPGSAQLLLRADREQLMRVFTNLINNAYQAIPPDRAPAVRLSAQQQGPYLALGIHDNGTGIPAERAEKIFEPRFTTKSHGMGLGLALVKRIVDGLGGQIDFQSRPEVGTSFAVLIPLVQTEQTA